MVVMFVNTAKRGAFKAVSGIVGTLGGLILGMRLSERFAPKVEAVISPILRGAVEKADLPQLADNVMSSPAYQSVREFAELYLGTSSSETAINLTNALAEHLAATLAPVVTFIAIFIAVKAVVTIVCNVLSIDWPILGTLNHMAGAVLGAVSGIVLVFALCWGILNFAPEETIGNNLSCQALRESHIGGIVAQIIY